MNIDGLVVRVLTLDALRLWTRVLKPEEII